MIASLPDEDRPWVQAFFSPPNDLVWQDLDRGTARPDQIEAVAPWLARLNGPASDAPLILPFYRGGRIAGWYATSLTAEGRHNLASTLRAWLGASYLTVFEVVGDANPAAAPLRKRFGEVLSFTGPEPEAIAARLALLARLEAQRPRLARAEPRPVGRIRADLEKALLTRDESQALGLIAELRGTGRLNEENLQFVDIRLKAGLGHWRQIALDHWAVQNLSDLPLPPQTLSDLVEALYRTHVDGLEDRGPQAILAAFKNEIFDAFPRLFASRHGVRTPRVLKAFILAELLQVRPNAGVLATLKGLLPAEDTPWVQGLVSGREATQSDDTASAAASPTLAGEADSVAQAAPPARAPLEAPAPEVPASPRVPDPGPSAVPFEPAIDEAQLAYEDGQIDRAFEIDLASPLSRKSLMRLLACARFIGTAEARSSVLEVFDVQPDARLDLSEGQIAHVEALRQTTAPMNADMPSATPPQGWLDWARRLAAGKDLDRAVTDALDNRATWETADLRRSPSQCSEFADLIGNLDGLAADSARQSMPLIMSAFFPEDAPVSAATRPVANVILLLIAMDDAVAQSDLESLSTVVGVLLDLGLSASDYLTMVGDLEAIQSRAASFANLAWSLDICETLAVSPTPSVEGDAARLRFFLAVVGQCQAFAHRLTPADFLPIEYLARDFGVDPASIAGLRPAAQEAPDALVVDLAGKLVGIYTLTEAAGSRAKAALLTLFPGCRVEVNSDKVSTTSLTNLARTADIFVFAWRSSSHQAFYCVKEALGGRDPTYAAGKGTASIVNAVRDAAA